MIFNPSRMWTCRWARRSVHRYLDADPSAPLSAQEIARLKEHLAICDRCAAMAEDYRWLCRALGAWSRRRAPDPALVERVHAMVHDLIAEDAG